MAALHGRTALVTGGGSGIGRAIARDLSRAGAKVIVIGRRAEPLNETVGQIVAGGGEATARPCDLTDAGAIAALTGNLIAEYGLIDLVVNNAGFNSRIRSTLYIGAEEWRAVMDTNTLGPAMLTRDLLPPMIEAGRGDVVMISSMAALDPSIMAGAVYSASKSAVRSYMGVLADEVRQYGIRCTTIFPGEVDTPIMDHRALVPGSDARALMMQPEDISAAVLMAVSLPQRAMVTELAIGATAPRDMSADIQAAKTKKS